ncbi:p115 like vesicle tethering protein [Amanita rubescens]|nr:p115 like vesicle tethering protein [Amanita rubescens]
MEFLSQTYVALRGPTGGIQIPADTIARLSDRLSPATLLADRRASVLALKGLVRDCKQDVGDRALPGLLEVLSNDAEVDADIGKAVLETLDLLCDAENTVPGNKELGLKHTNQVLANEKAINTLFTLLGDLTFYTRFASLQLLSTLLRNRRQIVQGYFLKTSTGPASVISVLEDKREIIRGEGISVVQLLIYQNADIQKLLAFEGAFEKLFNIVTQEGGVEGGVTAEGALSCVDSLLRFNSSNQSYFRETTFPQLLCSLLFFPWKISDKDPSPQEFALQFWDDKKATNIALVIGIMGILVGSKGGNAQESYTFTRCLTEMALASNAPTRLKSKALRLLPPNANFPLSEITVTPYLPVPETNGEEWDRLESASGLDVVVELALHGEYNGLDSAKQTRDTLELRTAAVTLFESFVRKEEIKLAIFQGMLPIEGSSEPPPNTPLVHALAIAPPTTSALEPAVVLPTQIASILFSHLIRSSPQAKLLARTIKPGPLSPLPVQAASSFFVPADGAPSALAAPEPVDDDEPPQTLLQILSENLSLALLSRSRENLSERESREWDKLIIAYMCLLSQWLWEDPGSVRDFLDAGGMSVLVEQINHVSEEDIVVPALCVFLLGICYEFNRQPGEITRTTIAPILNRLGVDTLVGRMIRIREDDVFKSVGPDSPAYGHSGPTQPTDRTETAEIWFDWSFVDFWKSNYYTIQRGFSTEPEQLAPTSGQNNESTMLIASLREVIQKQVQEIAGLQQQLKQSTASKGDELQNQVATLSSQLRAAEERRKEVEKEQEDLLVLLDEMSGKRKAYKERLRQVGEEVSDDEDEDEEGEE